MIRIDGSRGEGGGQILRTSLALAMVTGQAFRVEKIRANRPRPGLMRQHLTAVRAAARVSSAHVTGDEIGSDALTFEPGPVAPGDYRFAIGTAGSATLVLQTVLPALMRASEPSHIVVEGGTHNSHAPCADFIDRAFAPWVRRVGCGFEFRLERHGFYPAGGGRIDATLTPGAFAPIEIVHPGKLVAMRAAAISAGLPGNIAMRELDLCAHLLGLDRRAMNPTQLDASMGPGNAVVVDVEREHVTEVMWSCGERGVSAERVSRGVVDEVREYLVADVPIGSHLADQLLLLLAVAAGGTFVTMAPTEHTRTQCDVIAQFLGTRPVIEQQSEKAWRATVRA